MKPIVVNNLRKTFGEVTAINDVSFSAEEGEILGFLGPNGAGKTTTIRCIMDLIRPDRGQVTVFGQPVVNNSAFLNKNIGFLSGEVNMYDQWTGKEHIELVKKMRGISHSKASELIDRFGYDPSKRIKTLSTGNKQKLGLILALLHEPKLLILDEPTSGLDPLLQQVFYDIITEQAQAGSTILISSHNLPEVEKICDRVVVIKKGKVVEIETIKNLKNKKIYTVYAYFDKSLTQKEEESLLDKNIRLEKRLNDGLILDVKGDIDFILQKLAKHKLLDLEIHHANLEKVFLEYYKN